MPHFDEQGRGTWICQICAKIYHDGIPSEWRPDLTGSESAGNVCPSCLKANEPTQVPTVKATPKKELVYTHKFTEAGLGQAPFRFIEIRENLFKMGDGTTKPGGCCDYCFTGIRYEFYIRSADGKKSKVGRDCIQKVNDHKLIEASKLAMRKFGKERKAQANRERIEKELRRQREVNGGRTNDEVRRDNMKAHQEQQRQAGLQRGLKWREEVQRLRDGKGGFRDSVADQMEAGGIPAGRGRDITIDILARQMGRRDSKAYAQEYVRLENLFEIG